MANFFIENGIHNANHQQYFLYLTPLDFYLFGKLKQEIIGPEFNAIDEFLGWIKK